MPVFLKEPSPEELVTAIEGNLLEYTAYRGQSPLAQFFRTPRAQWTISQTDIPFANQVCFADFLAEPPKEDLDSSINQMISLFESKIKKRPMTWLIGPSSRPKDLGLHLKRHGFIHIGSTPGMAVPLGALPDLKPASSSTGSIRVEPVRERAELQECLSILALGYNLPGHFAQYIIDIYASLGFSQERWRYYRGLLDGEVVGLSCLFLGAGVAGIYSVATTPSARGHGVGRAVTLAPLLEARAMGCHLGVLRSSDMALPLYQKLGFVEHCRFDDYLLKI